MYEQKRNNRRNRWGRHKHDDDERSYEVVHGNCRVRRLRSLGQRQHIPVELIHTALVECHRSIFQGELVRNHSERAFLVRCTGDLEKCTSPIAPVEADAKQKQNGIDDTLGDVAPQCCEDEITSVQALISCHQPRANGERKCHDQAKENLTECVAGIDELEGVRHNIALHL